mmetsp:Transcript_7298/g.6475  ORF Transcript_7298/g.6475 Transcript_7298/m.6475 type:complete len:114 (-) Transcript_7298:268-609(-)
MDASMLSMISQVIISIQTAIKKQANTIVLDDDKLPLKPNSAIFITINPGYAGRKELPLNLKNLFRPVSMVAPDSKYITEILLYSAGFITANKLGSKIVQVMKVAGELINQGGI